VSEPKQPFLPPGTGPKLAWALADLVAALLWFALSLLAGSDSDDLLGSGGGTNDVFAWIGLAAALTVGVTFGLRMASIAVERIPDWVPRVERWSWIALPIWFAVAVIAVRI